MAAPYRDKSLLEMSDRERKARRQADLRRPGRDAIEGVYPEQYVIPAARGIKQLLTPRQPTRLERIYNQPMPKEALDAQKQFPPEMFERAGKYIQAEQKRKAYTQKMLDEYIREQNKAKFRENMLKRRAEAPRKDMERALTDVVTKTEYTNIFGPQEEYKRGGVVKAKKHRGDGIIKRGATKGRFV